MMSVSIRALPMVLAIGRVKNASPDVVVTAPPRREMTARR
jgi:hypothetical protein